VGLGVWRLATVGDGRGEPPWAECVVGDTEWEWARSSLRFVTIEFKIGWW